MAGPTGSCPSESENSTASSLVLDLGDADLEEEEAKICAVCGDRATGYHFHAMTCEGCKGFFRRAVLKGTQFTCSFACSCAVTKAKRRQCQACRYQKCLAVGMKKDMIMSEEVLHAHRELRRRKQRREPSPPAEAPENGRLTADQQELIEIFQEAYKKNVDPSFSPFTNYQPPVRLFSHSPPTPDPEGATSSPRPQEATEGYLEDVLPDVFSALPLFADLTTFLIQQAVRFAKALPFFRSLPVEDQICLLKGAALEVGVVQINMAFDLENNAWECGAHGYSIAQGALAGFQPSHLDQVQKFHVRLRKLNLHDTEYVLLQALLLFSPDDGHVTQREAIDQIQERIALTLKSYIDCFHPPPEGRFLYAKLLLLLTELRTLKAEGTRQIHHNPKGEDLISMTPLLSEILS